MNRQAIVDALALPPGALVGQRVPKKLLLEQGGAPTAADKRRIQDGIEELVWTAALKPTNIGVPAFRDDSREYLEVALLTGTFRPAAKSARLIELIHRAIPYPVVLISEQEGTITLSLAHKRWSQGEAGKVVVEGLRQLTLDGNVPVDAQAAFLSGLAVSGLPARDMFALYQGLFDRLLALESARITGAYAAPESPDSHVQRRESLDRHAQVTKELANLRAAAHKERQLNRRVALNLEIKRLEAELNAAKENL
jgi:hypothetical protein